MNRAAPVAPPPSPMRLLAAPHRLLFFVGASNVLLAMAWWAAWLAAPHLGAAFPQPATPAGWLHAFVMQYQMLPSFIFGFLLTTFPRWMGLPDIDRWRYAPVGIGLFGGQVATLLGALGWDVGLTVGLWMTVAGWAAGLATLAPLLWREAGATWHARSCFAALTLGAIGLAGWLAFVLGLASPSWAFASIKLGTFGLLLPVYLTVAHRMFPFFAANAVPGYRAWRPLWLLAIAWPLLLAHLALELVHAYAWTWLADLPLLALTTAMLWRWWPRGDKPALLTVLFAGFAWLPVAFALYAAQSLWMAATGEFALGRAPAHALFVGFFGSLLVAMVTRVTQGHSGRPLAMPKVATYAFVAINVVAVLRIAAELAPDPMRWHALVAAGWLVALGPWIARIARIYLSPRADGKPG
ncbi:NnrS family protein [Lysobacter sp. N42]|uniref:NnrS family protein n=1 Tax=Lysobacter sp. N42 TaxID=2545719 RepID=UPI00104D6A91|nr:NnrS family protein [Lysobacter sp. N42]TCZ82441.1 NnrS family protein [Lysobacter sp. N42]